MKAKPHIKGATFVEIMVAVTVLLSAVLGAMLYQYYTAMDAKKAMLHIKAARLAVTVLEGWKGAGSKMDFDPLQDLGNGHAAEYIDRLGMTSGSSGSTPSGMNNPETVGGYNITSEGVRYAVTLFYEDLDDTDNIPAALTALVEWPEQGYGGLTKSFVITGYECY